MVWPSPKNGQKEDPKDAAPLGATHGRRRRGRPRTMWTDVIQRDLLNLGLRWSVEEAEIAAQDRTVWKILTSQAAGADMHYADWLVHIQIPRPAT